MALVLKDRVKETTTSTGTGTINLAGAATGFEGFASAVGDGNTCYYAILDADGSAWEVGIGTVTDAATDTLSRDTILESSNSDNAISLTSGTHTVFLTYPADKSVYRNSNDQIVATASGIVFSDSTVQTTAAAVSGDNVSIFVNDAGYLTTESDTLQTVTDRGSNTTNSIFTSGNVTATSGYFDTFDMTLLGNGEQPSHSEGRLFYDSENHTITMYNDEADIALQIGQEQYVRVRNNTAATIGNGTAVLFNGVHGNSAPTISGAIATSEATSQVIGLATHSIEPNSFGYVTTYGVVRDVDTSAFSAGDELYLSATQIGSGVNISPVIPNFKVTLGHVITSSFANGSILVQVGNAKLGGGDVKSEGPLNVSGVPFITSISDTTAGGSLTDPSFIFDSGNRQLQLASGVQLLNAVPANTTNVLYNDGGTLKFNGSAVDTDTTYTAGSGLELDSTTFNAKTATTSASGITTLTNTIDSTQTKALTPKAVNDAGYLTAHPSISAASDSNNSGRTYIQDLLLDSNGHVTGITTATETVTDTNTTYTAGSGLQLNGTVFEALTATTSGSGITILTDTINGDQDKALTPKAVNDAAYLTAHPSISAASSSDNSGRTYIQDLLLDSNGHVTGVATATETVTDTNTTYTAGTGITLNGTEFDIDPTLISGRTEVTSADADYLLVWDADDSQLKKVDAGEFRGGGGGGDITSVVAGTGLSGGGTTGDVTIDVSGVDVSLLQGTVPVSKGGTNATSLADKAVLITQDTGTDTVSAAVMDANGELLIGGTSGPAVATLTQGSNVTITNADGGITIAATDTNTTYTGGTNLTLAGTTFNVDDAFLVNDADDTTTGTITAGGLSTTGVVALGESTYQHKFDRYKLTGVTSSNAVAITLGGSALSDHYAYRIRCYDEDSSNLNGSVFLVRENNSNTGWDVKTVSIQKNSAGEFPEVFDDSGTVKVKTGTAGTRDIIVYIEAIFINRNDVTGFIWGGDFIWSKVTNAAGTVDNIYTSGNVGVGTETPVSAINLVGGSYVNEAVPASDTPTTEDATVTLDLSDGNYHNIVLGANVTKFEFTNAKRGQKFILRITQHASSAKTVSWSNVDSDTGGTAATVRWAGNITPTMSTSTSHTDVYGFLCTNNAGSNFDGFIIGQDLPD